MQPVEILFVLNLLRRERWCVSQGPQTVCARVKYCADGTASYEPMCWWHKELIHRLILQIRRRQIVKKVRGKKRKVYFIEQMYIYILLV